MGLAVQGSNVPSGSAFSPTCFLCSFVKLRNISPLVAFPNRKSYIFDNKLDFSGIKLAESYGFRYSNFKVNSQVIQVSLWCFKFKPFGYFRLQWYWLYPHDGTGSPSWRRKQPMCLFKG